MGHRRGSVRAPARLELGCGPHRRSPRPGRRREEPEHQHQSAATGQYPPSEVAGGGEMHRYGAPADARYGGRPDDGDAERLPDLAACRGDGARHTCLTRRHPRDGGVGDRSVHDAETDPEDHVGRKQTRERCRRGEAGEKVAADADAEPSEHQ